MTTNEYIDDKIAECVNKIKELNYRLDYKGLLCLMGGVICAAAFPIVFTNMFFYALSLAGLSIGCFSSSAVSKRLSKLKSDRYNNEKDHLNRIKQEGMSDTPDLRNRRNQRLSALNAKKEMISDKLKRNKRKSRFLFALTGVGAIAGLALGGVASLVGLGAGVLKLITDNIVVNDAAYLEKVNTSINNISNDVDILSYAARRRPRSAGTSGTNSNTHQATRSATRRIPHPVNNQQISGELNQVQQQREDAVNRYIERMAQSNNLEDNKQKRKVKDINN